MKQQLLKLTLLFLCLTGGTSAWAADDVVETLTPTVDTYLRYDNTTNHGSEATMELKTYASGNADFVGYMSFTLSKPAGYRVKSAILRVTTERIKGDRTLNVHAFDADVAGNATYATYSDAITTAKASAVLGTVELEGEMNKALTSSSDGDKIADSKYQTIDKWQNKIDLTSYFQSVNTSKVGLLLVREDANNANKIFTSEATASEYKNQQEMTVTDADLKPQLTVTYEVDSDVKVVTTTSTADGYVRGDNSNDNSKYGTTDQLFIVRKDGGAQMYGYMTFKYDAQPGYELESATLRLTAERVKGDSKINIYPLDAATTEDATYNTLSPTSITGSATKLFSEYEAQGQSASIKSDAISETYRDITKWQNTFNLTSYVKGLSGNAFGLLFERVSTSTGDEIHFFTREATAFTNTKDADSQTFTSALTADDLKPQLTLTYRKVDSYTLTVGDAKAATLVLPFNATIPSGVKAYMLNYTSGDAVTATEVTGTLTANTPVLINAEAGNHEFTRTGDVSASASPKSGALTGVYAETTPGTDHYILTNKYGKVGFRKTKADSKVPAYRCYLTAESGAHELSIIYDDNVTGIRNLTPALSEGEGVYYNLKGQRVANPTKGIFIVNGKKILMK